MTRSNTEENRIELYDYDLPRDQIAQQPPEQRVSARMMVVHRDTGRIEHCQVRDLPQFLRPGDSVVVNDTQVIPARLIGFRTLTGGRWEGLYLQSDPETGMADMLCKTRGKMAIGETVTLRDCDGREVQRLVLISQQKGGHAIFRPEPAADWQTILKQSGRVPLPPYIRNGEMMSEDIERYQTVFARKPGSVAAPTAGLHITPDLVKSIREAGSAFVTSTLHVGIGTFRPIQVDDLNEHRMHSEWCELTEPVVKRLQTTRSEGGRIVAIGTTTVRVLESVASKHEGVLKPWQGETDLFITPGFKFNAVDALLTNFHLPRSSLLVMVSAFATRELILRAYQIAVEEGYRFYSYGDCMLIL